MIEEALESDENLDGVHGVHIYCIVLQCIYKINELNSVEIIRLKIY